MDHIELELFAFTLEDQKVASALLRKMGRRIANANAIGIMNCLFVLDFSIAYASTFRLKVKQRLLTVSLPLRSDGFCQPHLSVLASAPWLYNHPAHAKVLDGLDNSRPRLYLPKIGLH
jgi:hypothetical protein